MASSHGNAHPVPCHACEQGGAGAEGIRSAIERVAHCRRDPDRWDAYGQLGASGLLVNAPALARSLLFDGKRLGNLRRKAGWTQPEVAARCGVARITVTFWEMDRIRPAGQAARRLIELHREWRRT